MVRLALVSLLAVGLVISFTRPAQAKDRRVWRDAEGFYENVKGNNWIRKFGEKTFHFQEKKRTEAFIELYDKERDIWVRLFNDRREVKLADSSVWKPFPGKWD